MSDSGVWVKVHPDDAGGGAPGAAVISGHRGATVQRGKNIGDKTYDIYTFTDDTRNDMRLTVAPDGAGYVDALLVGGGGAGNRTSNNYCGGGGAGDFVELSLYLDAGNHDITVGSGGVSQVYTIDRTDDGLPSKLGFAALAMGGGAGAHSHPTQNTTSDFPNPGASSGGATGGTAYGAGKALGLNGNQGAVTGTNALGGGGGGGAGSPGGQASGATGGNGGAGKPSMITGSQRWFAAGGGGAGSSTSGAGGSGVGGTGSGSGSASATPPEANSGSGGGGTNAPNDNSNGAAGIVIVRVEV